MATSVGNGMRNHVSAPPVSACARAACTRPCQDFLHARTEPAFALHAVCWGRTPATAPARNQVVLPVPKWRAAPPRLSGASVVLLAGH